MKVRWQPRLGARFPASCLENPERAAASAKAPSGFLALVVPAGGGVTLESMTLSGEYLPSPSDWAREQAELYESSGGLEGTTLKGQPVVVLTTVGARTGGLRKTPLMRVEHDGSYAVVASRGGAPQHPQWYFNLVANPIVELQDGPVVASFQAREVTGAEKDEWWQRAVEVWPPYDEYQAKTTRQIPVFVLERVP